ncbi:hypothetical protein [Kribbella voronezhensis]|uniref:hypothetical protein n=1 Tax=Kribbella voronezhensis TaxID=2512212 RepID=UPI00192DCFA8|nr:hypothetical protein [Kribbella voronezhensis]
MGTKQRGRRRWLRRLAAGTAALVLLVLAAGIGYFGYVLSRRSDPIALPAPTGQYKVGRTTFEWTDTARRDPFVAGLPRKLSVWLWYPAAADAGGQRAEYAPGLWDGLHLQGPIAPFEGRFESLRDNALRDVPVATGRHPVVVLEPGMGFSAPQYAVLAEDLASHGYLVAGVTPTYSANLTVLDGQVVGSLKAANPEDLGRDTPAAVSEGDRLVMTWAADARFAAHQVATAGGLLAGRVDTVARVVYVGHSFGGAASLEGLPAGRSLRGSGRPGRQPVRRRGHCRSEGADAAARLRGLLHHGQVRSGSGGEQGRRRSSEALADSEFRTVVVLDDHRGAAFQLHRLRHLLPGCTASKVPCSRQR